jgi:hypothetical protein
MTNTTVYFTTVKKNGTISKHIYQDENGNLVKDSSGCSISYGKYYPRRVEGLRGFKKFLEQTKSSQHALVHGVPKWLNEETAEILDQIPPQRLITVQAEKDGKPGISRSKDNFGYPPPSLSPSVSMFDGDFDSEQQYFTPTEFIEIICLVFPEFSGCGVLIVYSTSSFIYKDDTPLTANNPSYHIYFLVKDGADIKRFSEVLFKRLWLEGYGHIKISKAGAQLVRTIFDIAVFSPERLDFIALAQLGPGLTQKRPDPRLIDGDVLDTRLLPDLTADEEQEYERLVREAKEKARPAAQKKEDEYVEQQAEILMQNETAGGRTLSKDQAQKIVRNRKNGHLSGKDILHFDNLGQVSVEDVLKNPQKYDGETLRDPVEPETGPNKAKFYSNPGSKRPPIIHSFLHGGSNYVLSNRKAITQVRTELDDLISLYEGKSVPKQKWFKIIHEAHLSKADVNKALQHLVIEGVGKKRQLKAEYKTLLKQHIGEQRMAEIQAAAKERVLVEYEPDQLNKMVNIVDSALVQGADISYVRYGGIPCYVLYEKSFANNNSSAPKPVIKPHTQATMTLLIDKHVSFYKTDSKGLPTSIKVPKEIVQSILENPNTQAQTVFGVVSHPVINQAGIISHQEGIDTNTNLILMLNGQEFPPVSDHPTQDDAKEAIGYLQDTFLDEISFAKTHSDISGGYGLNTLIAISILLTGFVRKIIDIAPAFVITASTQGTGKTTLARICHLLITGNDMPVHSLGGSHEESEKQILAILMSSPAMVVYDNQFDGSQVISNTLSRATTSATITGRFLGKTQEISVPTNTVFVITGNNLTISSDLLRRILLLTLHSDLERPENKTYRVKDVVRHCVEHRPEAVKACLTIIKAYLDSGAALESSDIKGSGFPEWDRMVRFPILWATGVDILDAMELSRNESEEDNAMTGIIEGILSLYGTEKFKSRDLFNRLRPSHSQYHDTDQSDEEEDLIYNFSQIAKKATESEKSFVYVLRKLKNRNIKGLKLNHETNSSGNKGRYWVEIVDPERLRAYEAEQSDSGDPLTEEAQAYDPQLGFLL